MLTQMEFNKMSKQCWGCFKVRPLSEYYKTSKYDDGEELKPSHFKSRCKDCTRVEAKKTATRSYERAKMNRPSAFWDCDNCKKINNKIRHNCRICGFPREEE